MKNNFITYLLSIFIFFICHNILWANEFTFDALEINISDKGNIINATDGTATTKEGNIIIRAKEFEYNKFLSILDAYDGVATLIEKNITIKANKFIYNREKFLIEANGEVEIKDLTKKILIKSESIFYDQKNEIIRNDKDSTIEDNLGNIIKSEKFIYTLNDNLVKLDKAEITGVEKDVIKIEKSYFNLLSKKLIGKDISIDFNNANFQKENEPRLKGNSISSDLNKTLVTKGIFTTCKRNDDCPPWQISAKEIQHDKEKKMIFYKDAWLKIYDKPVFYFPKFFHPDPTVKRQSGFLMPAFLDSSTHGASFQLPYFHVISDNKDLTLSPRFYSNDKLLAQTEYRQVNSDSKHLLDFSFFTEKGESTKSHFFLNSNKNIDFSYFEESELSLKVEQVSNDTYLKTYKLESPIINDNSLLKSSMELDSYKEGFTLNTKFEVYEDLSQAKSDRYEYVMPDYTLVKEFDTTEKLSGNFSLESSGYIKNYDTNIYERVVINDFIFNSNSTYTNSGLKNEYNLLVKNVNTDSDKSKNYKETLDHKLLSIVELNSSYPLKKEKSNYKNILKPTVSLRYSPTNTSKDLKSEDRRINTGNIFSLNRIATNDTVEGGASLTYGTEFLKTNILDKEILNIKVANVLKFKEDKKLPVNSSLGKKTSDVLGNIVFSPNDIFSIGYEFARDENLIDTNYETLKGQFSVNNFVTTFEYLNENNLEEGTSFLSNKTSYIINKSNNISFETRENKKTSLTEFYNLIYQYRNDCLIAAIEYNKDYYTDRDLKPDESIFLKLTIVPFGQTSSPNLKK